jgi:hypothetical protein
MEKIEQRILEETREERGNAMSRESKERMDFLFEQSMRRHEL